MSVLVGLWTTDPGSARQAPTPVEGVDPARNLAEQGWLLVDIDEAPPIRSYLPNLQPEFRVALDPVITSSDLRYEHLEVDLQLRVVVLEFRNVANAEQLRTFQDAGFRSAELSRLPPGSVAARSGSEQSRDTWTIKGRKGRTYATVAFELASGEAIPVALAQEAADEVFTPLFEDLTLRTETVDATSARLGVIRSGVVSVASALVNVFALVALVTLFRDTASRARVRAWLPSGKSAPDPAASTLVAAHSTSRRAFMALVSHRVDVVFRFVLATLFSALLLAGIAFRVWTRMFVVLGAMSAVLLIWRRLVVPLLLKRLDILTPLSRASRRRLSPTIRTASLRNLVAFGAATALCLAGAGVAFVGLAGILIAGDILVFTAEGVGARTAQAVGLMLVATFVVLGGLASLLQRWLARQARVRLAGQLNQERVQSVLLLRGFEDDELRLRSRFTNQRSMLDRLSFRRFERFEEIVAWSLASYAPVVTVGQPGVAPDPVGAARHYFEDDQWQVGVQQLIAESPLVVVLVGGGNGLQWEIRELLRSEALSRTLFVVPPVSPDESRERVALLAQTLGVFVPDQVERPGFDESILGVRVVENNAHIFTSRVRDEPSYQAMFGNAVKTIADSAAAVPPLHLPTVRAVPVTPRRAMPIYRYGIATLVVVTFIGSAFSRIPSEPNLDDQLLATTVSGPPQPAFAATPSEAGLGLAAETSLGHLSSPQEATTQTTWTTFEESVTSIAGLDRRLVGVTPGTGRLHIVDPGNVRPQIIDVGGSPRYAVSSGHSVIVSDPVNRKLLTLTSDGAITYLEVPTLIPGPMAQTPQALFVTDLMTDEIVRMNRDGDILATSDELGRGVHSLVVLDEVVAVYSRIANEIVLLDLDTLVLQTRIDVGDGLRQISSHNDVLYVPDPDSSLVRRYDGSGRFLGTLKAVPGVTLVAVIGDSYWVASPSSPLNRSRQRVERCLARNGCRRMTSYDRQDVDELLDWALEAGEQHRHDVQDALDQASADPEARRLAAAEARLATSQAIVYWTQVVRFQASSLPDGPDRDWLASFSCGNVSGPVAELNARTVLRSKNLPGWRPPAPKRGSATHHCGGCGMPRNMLKHCRTCGRRHPPVDHGPAAQTQTEHHAPRAISPPTDPRPTPPPPTSSDRTAASPPAPTLEPHPLLAITAKRRRSLLFALTLLGITALAQSAFVAQRQRTFAALSIRDLYDRPFSDISRSAELDLLTIAFTITCAVFFWRWYASAVRTNRQLGSPPKRPTERSVMYGCIPFVGYLVMIGVLSDLHRGLSEVDRLVDQTNDPHSRTPASHLVFVATTFFTAIFWWSSFGASSDALEIFQTGTPESFIAAKARLAYSLDFVHLVSVLLISGLVAFARSTRLLFDHQYRLLHGPNERPAKR